MSPSGEDTLSEGTDKTDKTYPTGKVSHSGRTDKTDKTPGKTSTESDPQSFRPPNWKNPSEYPDSEKTTDREWGWEFLRRSPEFQNDFIENWQFLKTAMAIPPLDSEKVGYKTAMDSIHPRPTHFYWTKADGWDIRIDISPLFSNQIPAIVERLTKFRNKWVVEPFPLLVPLIRLPSEHVLNPFSQAISGLNCTFHQLSWLEERFGTPILLEPKDTFRPTPLPPVEIPWHSMNVWDRFCGVPRWKDPDAEDRGENPDYFLLPAQTAFVFDYRLSWDEQAKRAKAIFRERQKEMKRIGALTDRRLRSDKFVHYLRLLDAIFWTENLPDDEKYTYSDIYRVLFNLKTLKQSDDSSYRATITEDLKVARQWRDSDFRLLFAS